MSFVVGRGKYARAVYPVARHSVVAPDEKVKVTAADTTPGFLAAKIPSTSDVQATIGTPSAPASTASRW